MGQFIAFIGFMVLGVELPVVLYHSMHFGHPPDFYGWAGTWLVLGLALVAAGVIVFIGELIADIYRGPPTDFEAFEAHEASLRRPPSLRLTVLGCGPVFWFGRVSGMQWRWRGRVVA